MEEYPYFIYPDVMALRSAADPQEAARLRRKIAANTGDLPSLRIMLGMDPEEFARFYPDMTTTTMSTVDTIDSFLSRFGQPDAPVSRAASEIPESAPAYVLEEAPRASGGTPADSTSEAIDAFLASAAPESSRRSAPAPDADSESEQFARICIKNHDYQTALEIITRLRLNNPEKSIYFADQIRFLRKLILNQSKKEGESE